MIIKPLGLCRKVGEKGEGNNVLVEYGALRFHIPEQRYRDKGIEPAFDNLPWALPCRVAEGSERNLIQIHAGLIDPAIPRPFPEQGSNFRIEGAK